LFVLAEPGRIVVCQDRTGPDCPRHFHLRARSGSKVDSLCPSLQPSSQARQMDVPGRVESNQNWYQFVCYTPLAIRISAPAWDLPTKHSPKPLFVRRLESSLEIPIWLGRSAIL